MSEESKTNVRDASEADFEEAVLKRSHTVPVVVDFWAEWCRPCVQLGPLLEKLVQERKGAVELVKVNVEQSPKLAQEYHIDSIPAVKGFRDGQVALEFFGLLPEAHIRDFLDRIVPKESDVLVQQATALEASKPADAEQVYRKALELDRGHLPSLVGLARVLIGRSQAAEAVDLLAQVGPAGALGAEAERLRGTVALQDLGRDLSDEATLRGKLKADPENAELHYELGCVLAVTGRYRDSLDELLQAGRADKKLAGTKVKDLMVRIFNVIGQRSDLADEYRDKLTKLLY